MSQDQAAVAGWLAFSSRQMSRTKVVGTNLFAALSRSDSATLRSTRKASRKQRPSSAVRVTTSEDWLRAGENSEQEREHQGTNLAMDTVRIPIHL
jgi:hypothetical protein